MKLTFILFFILFSIIQIGILTSAWPAYKSDHKPISLKYWSIAIANSSIAYICFAVSLITSDDLLNKSNFSMTMANTFILSGVIFQGLYVRALRTEISRKTIKSLLTIIIIFGIYYETTRGVANFESRSILVGFIIFNIYLWQLYEVSKSIKTYPSIQLKLLFAFVFSEAVFILLRLIVIFQSNLNIQKADQIPAIVSILVITQLTLNILAFISMIGYWFEATTKATVVTEYENIKMRALLEERSQLLSKLVKAKKIAELSAMSTSIAHEINQPLGAIKINLWSLKRTFKPNSLTDFQDKLINNITEDTDRVSKIISTIRSIFKNEEYIGESFLIAEFIKDLFPIFQSELSQFSAELIIEVPDTLKAKFNKNELTLVLLNLISNSVKANSKKIIITAIKINNQVKVVIADNGPGIPFEKLNNLFEITKTGSDGLGLGLWLSRYIVERGAGSIYYRQNEPEGSQFILKLPLGT